MISQKVTAKTILSRDISLLENWKFDNTFLKLIVQDNETLREMVLVQLSLR